MYRRLSGPQSRYGRGVEKRKIPQSMPGLEPPIIRLLAQRYTTELSWLYEEIKRRLNLGNVCYHSVQIDLSSRVFPRNLNIKICKVTILPVVLYECETWSLTLSKEH
jgi:hypothetical protein